MKKALISAGVFALDAMAVISFYLAFNNIRKAILWSTPIIIGSLLVIIVSLLFQNNQLSKDLKAKEDELSDLKKRHEELSKLFSAKRKKLDNFETLWGSLNTVFINALQGSKEKRFEQAYQLYLQYTSIKDNYEEDK